MVSFGQEASQHLQVNLKFNGKKKWRKGNLSSCFIMIAGGPQIVRMESYISYVLKIIYSL